MTVRELIDILKTHEQDAVVMRGDSDGSGEPIETSVDRIEQRTIVGETTVVALW